MEFSPASELCSGCCRFSVHRVSLPDLRTATFARFCPPVGVSSLPGGIHHCRLSIPPYPFSGLRGFSRCTEVPVGFERRIARTTLLAPCPLWDLYPSENSPFVQLPPFRASCSLAFSQGCEASIQTKVPCLDLRSCRPGRFLSWAFSTPQYSLTPDILPPPAGSRHALDPVLKVFPADRPAASSRTSRPLYASSSL
jgi:hypothetical protein